MSKYHAFRPERESRPKMEVHPIWRGIGFLFIIIAPIVAYFATNLILTENRTYGWFVIPRDLMAKGADPYLFVKIISTLVIMFLLYAIFLVITFLLYRALGPSRLGPLDVKQKSFRGKQYRR